eukprot:CAMPEP_0180362410 /NCGR_PEP_ID=MMETSP0989-20121125/13319_1 /TAXON_ID=697907 /ORGANISM="non described non described, Strain CCMP2293" /LENGTH=254 /DNA_ID=CAMNT_0022354461 /DNA_START=53 /DNA_END=814 /DNA_ORIENTATION=+
MVDYSKWSNAAIDKLLDSDDEDAPKPPPAPSAAQAASPPRNATASVPQGAAAGGDSDAPLLSVGEASALEAMPLPVVFSRAKAMYHEASQGGMSEEATRRVEKALLYLGRAERLVSAEAVFSKNEEAQDVNTPDLKYVLIPFYEGELLQRCSDINQRRKRLKAASEALFRFLRHCNQLEMGAETARTACRKVVDDADGYDGDQAPAREAGGPVDDAWRKDRAAPPGARAGGAHRGPSARGGQCEARVEDRRGCG